jgi:hypothetical protein
MISANPIDRMTPRQSFSDTVKHITAALIAASMFVVATRDTDRAGNDLICAFIQ